MVPEGTVAPFKEPKVMRTAAAQRDQNSRGQLPKAAGPRSGAVGDGVTEPRAARGAHCVPGPVPGLALPGHVLTGGHSHSSRFLGEHIEVQRG